MALTASDITLIRAWTEGGTAGKTIKCRQVQFTLSADGGTAGDLCASIFGLTQVTECSILVESGGTAVLALPVYDQSTATTNGIVTGMLTTGELYFSAADVSGTYRCVVKGF